MGVRLYINNYSTKLTAQLLVGGATANVTAGDGAALAGADGDNYFIGTLRRMSGFRDVAREIIKITNRATDALTIARAQEGTAALQFEVGDQLDVDVTAAAFDFRRKIVSDGGTARTVLATDSHIICNSGIGTFTLTLPNAATYIYRELHVLTIVAFAVISDAANVIPLTGGSAGTAILAATDGKWALLVSNGTNWQIMAAN